MFHFIVLIEPLKFWFSVFWLHI